MSLINIPVSWGMTDADVDLDSIAAAFGATKVSGSSTRTRVQTIGSKYTDCVEFALSSRIRFPVDSELGEFQGIKIDAYVGNLFKRVWLKPNQVGEIQFVYRETMESTPTRIFRSGASSAELVFEVDYTSMYRWDNHPIDEYAPIVMTTKKTGANLQPESTTQTWVPEVSLPWDTDLIKNVIEWRKIPNFLAKQQSYQLPTFYQTAITVKTPPTPNYIFNNKDYLDKWGLATHIPVILEENITKDTDLSINTEQKLITINHHSYPYRDTSKICLYVRNGGTIQVTRSDPSWINGSWGSSTSGGVFTKTTGKCNNAILNINAKITPAPMQVYELYKFNQTQSVAGWINESYSRLTTEDWYRYIIKHNGAFSKTYKISIPNVDDDQEIAYVWGIPKAQYQVTDRLSEIEIKHSSISMSISSTNVDYLTQIPPLLQEPVTQCTAYDYLRSSQTTPTNGIFQVELTNVLNFTIDGCIAPGWINTPTQKCLLQSTANRTDWISLEAYDHRDQLRAYYNTATGVTIDVNPHAIYSVVLWY